MLSAVIAVVALLLFLALAASPARAATELSSIFESVARTAEALEVESAEPVDWFPVRGIVDFGEADARFGAGRGGHRHEGQDVFAPAGSPLFALRDGKVVETGDDGGRGNYVAIWSPEVDRTFVYLHMRAPTPFAVGDSVDGGARVGAVGCTGYCTGPHLHFEVRVNGSPVDPMPYLQ